MRLPCCLITHLHNKIIRISKKFRLKIIEDAACIEIYQPVCGCNNVTYSNECYASINGLTNWESGVCN